MPGAEPADALERFIGASEAIASAVETLGPDYLERLGGEVIDAWQHLDDDERAALTVELRRSAEVASRRVAGELRSLLSEPAAEQWMTPLEVVRTLPREPTQVLAGAGIPPVARDAFDERSWPADAYGLVPRSLADLGDPELGPLQLAWGLAKARILRGR